MHLHQGAGKSFVLRLKVKGMNLVGVVSWSSRIRRRCRKAAIRHFGSLLLR